MSKYTPENEVKKVIITKKPLVISIAAGLLLVLALSIFTPLSTSQTSNSPLPYTITTYGPSWDGLIAFDLKNNNNASENYLVVMDSNGTIVNMRQADSPYDGAIYNIAPDTLLFEGEPGADVQDTVWTTCSTHIWNFVTNTTEDFPNVVSEHDIQYNPINNTFLVLRDYIRQIDNTPVLFDKIMEVNSNGTVLWTWDTYDHIPLSEASPFNETSKTKITGETVEDFTHANTLDWDYNDGIIYLNLRNQNTFYKIDQTTGNIIWACGEFGNFTLLGANGQPLPNVNGLPPSLWYHSHDVKEVAPDVFTMFDNDYNNNTNPDDCHSQLLEITLNETSMTASVTRSWEAPTQYWNSYGGATLILPNGDFFGAFGDPTHQLTQNQPWNFNNTGAVLIEVNPAGQIVKTITFPIGWYIYRAEAITDLSSDSTTPTPTLTSTPTPTQSINPTVTPTVMPTSNTSQPDLTYGLIAAVAVAVIVVVVVLLSVLFSRKMRKLAAANND